jgi:hypothetical protein
MAFLLDKSDFFIPKEGKNTVRILPSWREGNDEEFFLEVPTHYEVTPECRALICRKIRGQECPVDAYATSLILSRNILTKSRGRRMQAVTRYMLNVAPDNGQSVKVWSVSSFLLQDLFTCMIDGGIGDVTDPVHGRNLLIFRAGFNSETRYTIQPQGETSRLRLKHWNQRIYNLDKCFEPPSYEEIMHILEGRVR